MKPMAPMNEMICGAHANANRQEGLSAPRRSCRAPGTRTPAYAVGVEEVGGNQKGQNGECKPNQQLGAPVAARASRPTLWGPARLLANTATNARRGSTTGAPVLDARALVPAGLDADQERRQDHVEQHQRKHDAQHDAGPWRRAPPLVFQWHVSDGAWPALGCRRPRLPVHKPGGQDTSAYAGSLFTRLSSQPVSVVHAKMDTSISITFARADTTRYDERPHVNKHAARRALPPACEDAPRRRRAWPSTTSASALWSSSGRRPTCSSTRRSPPGSSPWRPWLARASAGRNPPPRPPSARLQCNAGVRAPAAAADFLRAFGC